MNNSDLLFERYNNIKQIRKWKIILLSSIAIMCFYFLFQNNNEILPKETKLSSDYIALIKIENVIFEDEKTDKLLKKVLEDKSAKSLILEINSPGGTTVGAEKIYEKLLIIKKDKPVVAVLGTMATSGGYLAAIGADHIIAHRMTLTGSIGVLVQTSEVTDLAEKLGVKFQNFKSSPLKAAPNPMEKLTPDVEKAIMGVINDSYNYFVDLVSLNRKIPKELALKIADGRIYTGRQALELNLIDSLGTIDDAEKWLKEQKKLPEGLKIKHIKEKKSNELLEMIFNEFDSRVISYISKIFYSIKLV